VLRMFALAAGLQVQACWLWRLHLDSEDLLAALTLCIGTSGLGLVAFG